MKKIILLLMLSFSIVNFSACGVVNPIQPIIAGYTIWKDGEASRYYKWDDKITYKALHRALKELGHSVSEDEETKYGHKVIAGGEDRFSIKVISVEENITCIKIRINFLGDKPYAELLYKEIDAQINIIQYSKRK